MSSLDAVFDNLLDLPTHNPKHTRHEPFLQCSGSGYHVRLDTTGLSYCDSRVVLYVPAGQNPTLWYGIMNLEDSDLFSRQMQKVLEHSGTSMGINLALKIRGSPSVTPPDGVMQDLQAMGADELIFVAAQFYFVPVYHFEDLVPLVTEHIRTLNSNLARIISSGGTHNCPPVKSEHHPRRQRQLLFA